MRPWIVEKWNYIKADFEIAKHVPGQITLHTMFEIMGKKAIYSRDDAKKLHKNQMTAAEYKAKIDAQDGYTPDRMLEIFQDRAKYVIERGATLNNPHISDGYLSSWPTINGDYASELRRLVRDWRAEER